MAIPSKMPPVAKAPAAAHLRASSPSLGSSKVTVGAAAKLSAPQSLKANVPIETFDFGGAIAGTFFMGVDKNGVPQLKIPLVIRGSNRITPEYFNKVVKPVMEALELAGKPIKKPFDAAGKSVKTVLDAADIVPESKNFRPAVAEQQVQALKDGLETLYASAGIRTEVVIKEKALPFTPLEKDLLAGKPVGNLKDPKRYADVMEALRPTQRLGQLSDPKDLTLLLHPFPDITSPMVPTPRYGPTLGEPTPTALHEISHFLFMNRYEAYEDAFSPPNATMGDLSMHARLRAKGQPVQLSPKEKLLALNGLLDVASDAKLNTSFLKKAVKAAEGEVSAVRARAKVAHFVRGKLVDLENPKATIVVPEASKSVLTEANAAPGSRLLVVYDSKGAVESVSFNQRNAGYRRVIDGELFLTDPNLDFTIGQLLEGHKLRKPVPAR